MYSSRLLTPYTIALEYMSTFFSKKESDKIEIKSQYESEDIIKVIPKVVNLVNLYDIKIEFIQNRYIEEKLEDGKVIYKDTYTNEEEKLENIDESKYKYKYYKINMKLK